MTDRLFITHPDHPDRNGYVSRTAFDALWSKKGYEITEPVVEPLGDPRSATEDQLNAELDRRASADLPADVVSDVVSDDEKARLITQLEVAGVVVDGRWGLKRLRAEAANLTEDPA